MNRLRRRLKGIGVRVVRAEDRERVARAFRALEPESIYQRFFYPKAELTDEELRRLTEPDGRHDVVLVATVGKGREENIVGLGRYARNESSTQIAFTVEEDYQGRGIAAELLRRLTVVARGAGVEQFEADVLSSNAAMLKVFRRSGLPISERMAGGVVHLTLDLTTSSRKSKAYTHR